MTNALGWVWIIVLENVRLLRAAFRFSPKYWQHLHSPQWRAVVDAAIFIQLGKCYRCHLPGKLYGHHLHYATLGQERAGIDVVAVHWKCHEILDAERKASRTSKTDRTQ